MTPMQKSLVWVANRWLKQHHEKPGIQDCLSAVHQVVATVLFSATRTDQRVATRELLRRHGY
jgi:hypothetical protein